MRFQHLITIILILAVAGLLGWTVTTYTWEADWTYANRNSLTQGSKRVLDAMPGEITVTAYAYPGPKRQSIRDALDRYRRYDDSLRLRFVDPAKNPQKMRELGIRKNGAVRIAYKDREQSVKGLSEQQITSALQRLSGAGEQWVVFLTGHGERDPQNTQRGGYSKLRKALDRQGLKVRNLNLAKSPGIPDNTAALVLASPQKSLLPGEVSSIRNYLEEGGNLLWLNDPSDDSGPSSLADQLGITWQQGTVIYPDYQKLGTGDPAIALVLGYPDHPITNKLTGMTLFPYAGSVAAGKRDSGWQTRPIIKTPKRSWLEAGSLDQKRINFERKSGDQAGPVTIGMALTRPQPSDETDNAAESQADHTSPDEGANANRPQSGDDSATKQRVVAIADSDFLTNASISALSNRELGLGLFQWLGYRDKQIAVNVPAAPDDSLKLAPWQGRTIWLLFVIVLPLLLVSIGIGRWWLRRRR